MYQNKCTVFASFHSLFLTKLGNRSLGGTPQGQTGKFTGKNICGLFNRELKMREQMKSKITHD